MVYMSYAVKNEYMKCTRIGNLNVDSIESKAQQISYNYMRNMEKINTIVTFDKGCAIQSVINSMTELFLDTMEKFSSTINPIMEDIINGNSNAPDLPSMCTTGIYVLDNYFLPNKCLSQQEMNMAKSFFATTYHIMIVAANKWINEPKIHATIQQKAKDHSTFSKRSQFYEFKMMSHMVEDFRVRTNYQITET